MGRGCDPNREWVHRFEDEKELPPDEQVELDLRPLTAEEWAEAQDGMSTYMFTPGDENAQVPTTVKGGTQTLYVCARGIVRHRKLTTREGKPVPQVPEGNKNNPKIKEKLAWLSNLTPEDREEVKKAILKGSEHSKADEKNSDSPSSSATNGNAASDETTDAVLSA